MMTTLRALPSMRPAAKVGIVVAGYVIALLVTIAVAAVYIHLTDSPDRDQSSGMYAFGDSLLFLATLTLTSIPATGAVLYFLRPFRAFWIAISVASLAYAATAIPAVIDHFTVRAPGGPINGRARRCRRASGRLAYLRWRAHRCLPVCISDGPGGFHDVVGHCLRPGDHDHV